ncbi:MAG: methyltransferase domain-containing protein [Candidatus Thorarchaeota archaeon]|nr:methyltransferase domain-containing protein [Candidatus Thorarchaeota archaeon]
MKIPPSEEQELGVCCADFYNHPVVVKLLDGIFHPGGLALSNLMAEKMDLNSSSRVLDIACGDGMTGTYIAKKFSCHVAGIDAGENMINIAKQRAQQMRVSDSTQFKIGFAGAIPFPDEHFTAAYSECAVCTFQAKDKAVLETARVLDARGILGINDVVIKNHDDIDDELKGIIGRVACIAGALSSDGYVQLFDQGGFSHRETSNHTDLLEQMVDKAHRRAQMGSGIEEALSETANTDDILRMIGLIKDEISSENLGYEMFIFQKSR